MTGIRKRSNDPKADQSKLNNTVTNYKISDDPNMAKMQKEYFKATGGLLGTEPAATELKRLKKSRRK